MLDGVSKANEINSEETMEKLESLLGDLVLNRSTPLEAEESAKVLNVYDKLLEYVSLKDCNANSNLTITLKNRTKAYLDSIAEGFLLR